MAQHPPPLAGIKVIELAGLAPVPFAGLILADAGASVLRIDRPGTYPTPDGLTRHKTSIALDLKTPGGRALVLALARTADVLLEPFRPGVMERLGLGPAELLAANPRLVYARMTGFRRDGRYAAMAGHDINYLAVSGVLGLLGRAGAKPTPPINILGDFAGGGAMLVLGVLMALLGGGGGQQQQSRRGQVVEANMVDGAGYLATFPRFARKTPMGSEPRGENMLDSGCPFYDTYETLDGRWMAVGALEPQFYDALIRGLGLAGQGWEQRRHDRDCWAEMRAVFTQTFKSRTREAWEGVFDGTDACCTPVLEYGELEEEEEEEAGRTREGDQRPAVTLRGTPLLAVDDGGYEGRYMAPGEGGEETLKQWLGWERGRDFGEQDGGLVLLKTGAKL